MRFSSPLRSGLLLRRYKRFLADIQLEDGTEITAHVANPGSMLGVSPPGARVWLSEHPSAKRKLPWTWELVEVDGGLVAISTANPNRIVAEAIDAGCIPELTGYAAHRREVRYGQNSRVDFLLNGGRRPAPAWVEVKNVHLRRVGDLAEFPDCVTTRGSRHLQELSRRAQAGDRAVMLFVVQRSDCRRFTVAADIDPGYAAALLQAAGAGVELLCYDCEISTQEVRLRRPLPIEI